MIELKIIRRYESFGNEMEPVESFPDVTIVEAVTDELAALAFKQWCKSHDADAYAVDANSGEISVQTPSAILVVQYTDLDTNETLISLDGEVEFDKVGGDSGGVAGGDH